MVCSFRNPVAFWIAELMALTAGAWLCARWASELVAGAVESGLTVLDDARPLPGPPAAARLSAEGLAEHFTWPRPLPEPARILGPPEPLQLGGTVVARDGNSWALLRDRAGVHVLRLGDLV